MFKIEVPNIIHNNVNLRKVRTKTVADQPVKPRIS